MDGYIGILNDLTVQSSLKVKTYRHVQQALDNGAQMDSDQLKVIIGLFNKDLLLDIKYAPFILQALNKILLKIKEGELIEIPELTDIAKTVFCLLTMIAPLHQVQHIQCISMEVLINYPTATLAEVNLAHPECTYTLVDQYLGVSCLDMQLKKSVLNFLLKCLDLISPSKQHDFISGGLNTWFSRIIPIIFTPGSGHQEIALEIIEKMLPELSKMQYEDNSQWLIVYRNINDGQIYPQIIDKMLKSGDNLWSRCWCCIVRLLGIQLHKNGGPINLLLHVMENAFKMDNKTRCEAFRCWKVLIQNFALKPKDVLVHNPKRVKLLSIPLALNNAKVEEIAVLKFDIWWYFLKILQDEIILHANLVLIPFLQFCFGNAPKSVTSPINQVIPGLVFPQVQELAIKSFVEMVGHADCDGCVDKEFGTLKKRIINESIFNLSPEIWINSVQQIIVIISSNLEKKDKNRTAVLYQNAKCVWVSFLDITTEIEDPVKSADTLKRIFSMLDYWLDKCSENSCLALIMVSLILPAIAGPSGYSYEVLNKKNPEKNNQTHLQALITILLSPKLFKKEQMALTCSPYGYLVKSGLNGNAGVFCAWILHVINGKNHSIQVWRCMAQLLSEGEVSVVPTYICKKVLLWPITNNIETDKISDILSSWKKLLLFTKTRHLGEKLPKVYDDDIIEELLKTFSKCPHSSSEVTSFAFLSFILKQRYEDYSINEFKFLKYPLEGILRILNKSKNESDADFKLVELCCLVETLINALVKSNGQSTIANLHSQLVLDVSNATFASIVSIISQRKFIPISDTVIEELLGYLNSFLQSVVFQHTGLGIFKVILSMIQYDDLLRFKEQIIEIFKQIVLLNNKTQIIEKSEILKIQKILGNENLPEANSHKKSKEEFMIIKPSWKFNPKNLTEHQTEMMKRRKEDIPALYEDLSQSQDEFTIKGWRPPGYVSEGLADSSKSQDTSQSIDKKLISAPSDGKKNNVSPKIDLKNTVEVCLSAMKEFNAVPAPEIKKVQDAKKIKANAENIEISSPLTTPKRASKLKDSVRSRIDKNLRRLQESAIEKSPQTATENDELLEKVAEITENVLEPTKETSASIDTTINNEHAVTVSSNLTDNGIERPSRIKKKPNKFDPDYFSKKIKSTSAASTDSSSESSFTATSDEKPKSISHDIVSSHATPTKTKQRKSRLLSQLAIDTVEGHPSDLIKEVTRKRQAEVLESKVKQNFEPTKRRYYNKKKHPAGELLNGITGMSEITDILMNETPILKETSANENEELHTDIVVDIEINENIVDEISSSSIIDLPDSEDIIESSQDSSISSGSNKTPKRKYPVVTYSKPKIKPVDTCSVIFIPSEDKIDDSEIPCQQVTNISVKTAKHANEPCDVLLVENAEVKDALKESFSKLTSQQIAEADTEAPSGFIEKLAGVTNDNVTDVTNDELPVVKSPIEIYEESIIITNDESQDQIICNENDLEDIKFPIMGVAVYQEDSTDIIDITDDSDVPTLHTSIVSSPCIDDKENRTAEFLNSTLDMSPIKGMTSLTDSIGEIVGKEGRTSPDKPDANIADVPTLCSPEKSNIVSIVSSPTLFCSEKISPDKDEAKGNDNSPPRPVTLISSPSGSMAQKKSRTPINLVNGRAAQMLGLCQVDVEQSNIIQDMLIEGIKEMSPNATPVRKSLHSIYASEGINRMSENADICDIPVLELSKTLPSPYASPSGPILKKNHERDDHMSSPSSKRKRVSFHDPPVSTTICIKNYIEPPPIIRSPQQTYVRKVRESKKPMVVKCLVKNMESEANKEAKKLENKQIIDSFKIANNENDKFCTDSQMLEMCSLTVESPQIIEITNNYLLNNVHFIYPSLVDSRVPISEISSELSSPMWKENFIKDIESDVKTIGDLARMTELQINRLPIRTPKIKTVKRVLTNYESRFNEESEQMLMESSNFDLPRVVRHERDTQTEPLNEHLSSETQTDVNSFADIIINYKRLMVSHEEMCLDLKKSLFKDGVADACKAVVTSYAQSFSTEFAKIAVGNISPSTILENLSLTILTEFLLGKIEESDTTRQLVSETFKHVLEDQEQIRVQKENKDILDKVKTLLSQLK